MNPQNPQNPENATERPFRRNSLPCVRRPGLVPTRAGRPLGSRPPRRASPLSAWSLPLEMTFRRLGMVPGSGCDKRMR